MTKKKNNTDIFRCHRSPVALFARFLLAFIPLSFLYLFLRLIIPEQLAAFPLLTARLTLVYRVLCIVLMLEMARLYFNNLYVFGTKRVIQFSGRLSLRYSRISIAYRDVRDIGIRQSPLGRLLRYGTVTFGTSSRDGYEIEMIDLPFPRSVIAHVQEHMDKTARQQFDTDDTELLPPPAKEPTSSSSRPAQSLH